MGLPFIEYAVLCSLADETVDKDTDGDDDEDRYESGVLCCCAVVDVSSEFIFCTLVDDISRSAELEVVQIV